MKIDIVVRIAVELLHDKESAVISDPLPGSSLEKDMLASAHAAVYMALYRSEVDGKFRSSLKVRNKMFVLWVEDGTVTQRNTFKSESVN